MPNDGPNRRVSSNHGLVPAADRTSSDPSPAGPAARRAPHPERTTFPHPANFGTCHTDLHPKVFSFAIKATAAARHPAILHSPLSPLSFISSLFFIPGPVPRRNVLALPQSVPDTCNRQARGSRHLKESEATEPDCPLSLPDLRQQIIASSPGLTPSPVSGAPSRGIFFFFYFVFFFFYFFFFFFFFVPPSPALAGYLTTQMDSIRRRPSQADRCPPKPASSTGPCVLRP